MTTGSDYCLVAVPDIILPDGAVQRGTQFTSDKQWLLQAYRRASLNMLSLADAAVGRPMTGQEQADYDMLRSLARDLERKIAAMP